MKNFSILKCLLAFGVSTSMLVAAENLLKRGRDMGPASTHSSDSRAADSDGEESNQSEKLATTKRRELRAAFAAVVPGAGEFLSAIDRECEDIRARLKTAFLPGVAVPAGTPATEQRKALEDGAVLLKRLQQAVVDFEDLEFDEKKSHALADEMMEALASFGSLYFSKIKKIIMDYNECCRGMVPAGSQDPLGQIPIRFQQCRTADSYAAPLYALPRKKLEEFTMHLPAINKLFLEAVLANNIDAARHWVAQGAMLQYQDIRGQNALHHAVGMGFEAMLNYLLCIARDKCLLAIMLEQHDVYGFTPLYMAVIMQQAAAITDLLSAGANASAGRLLDGVANSTTVLHLAAFYGYKDGLDCIIAWARAKGVLGDYLKKQDTMMATPLQVAVMQGKEVAAICLLDAGADIKGCTVKWKEAHNCHTTALHIAATRGDIKMLEALTDWARAKNRLASLLDAQDDAGATPLHDAVENNHAEVVSFLLAAGADPEVEDYLEQTPLDLAKAQGFDHLIELFEYNATGPGADGFSSEDDSSEEDTSSSDDENSYEEPV